MHGKGRLISWWVLLTLSLTLIYMFKIFWPPLPLAIGMVFEVKWTLWLTKFPLLLWVSNIFCVCRCWGFFPLLCCAAFLPRSPLEGSLFKKYICLCFSKNGAPCPTCSSDCRASPVVGRVRLVFIVFIIAGITFHMH